MNKDELQGATCYKLRLRYGKWYLYLFRQNGETYKNVGEIGPFDNMPLANNSALNFAIAELKELGLADIEKDLGDKGK